VLNYYSVASSLVCIFILSIGHPRTGLWCDMSKLTPDTDFVGVCFHLLYRKLQNPQKYQIKLFQATEEI
jgi:hypothetical protein